MRQHAHNPVFWYPWSKEALSLAVKENKPILLSIGYSTCYWCHVMEREVFENASIATQMNQYFINIKVDREEHPQLDEIYMVARQLMTHEGGWPNNVFLTPDLKPFYAGGTYAAQEAYNKPAFPRLIEWLNHSWVTQEQTVRKKADEIAEVMQPFLTFPANKKSDNFTISNLAGQLFASLKEQHDAKSGGFFQAPKFPHECYLNFLMDHYEHSNSIQALAMVTKSLGKMAAGGIYDHVGCGFHRYAVDKEWFVPHFEKMLYNQAMLANVYTRAAVLCDSPYFINIAKSILDFSIAQLRSKKGGFYSAIDAETDQVEGAYYAWTVEELQEILSPEENHFFVSFYALADIPTFPGHKHTNGKAIIARKPLDIAAREFGRPYEELAALSAQIMNKLVVRRNQRKAPHLDDKIIVSWNGMMIAAYARAGLAFNAPRYLDTAKKAADYIMDNGFDTEGRLKRIADKYSDLSGTLEDYAYFIDGLIALYAATKDASLLNKAEILMAQAKQVFADKTSHGYFYSQQSERTPFRIKSGDDSTLPNANAMMVHNLVHLFAVTGKETYKNNAISLSEFFLNGNERNMLEYATMLSGALRLTSLIDPKERDALPAFKPYTPTQILPNNINAPDDVILLSVSTLPDIIKAHELFELTVTIRINEGWHINANELSEPNLIPTQFDIQANDLDIVEMVYPKPVIHGVMRFYEGTITIQTKLKFTQHTEEKPRITVRLRAQPCHDTTCHKVRDISLTF